MSSYQSGHLRTRTTQINQNFVPENPTFAEIGSPIQPDNKSASNTNLQDQGPKSSRSQSLMNAKPALATPPDDEFNLFNLDLKSKPLQ